MSVIDIDSVPASYINNVGYAAGDDLPRINGAIQMAKEIAATGDIGIIRVPHDLHITFLRDSMGNLPRKVKVGQYIETPGIFIDESRIQFVMENDAKIIVDSIAPDLPGSEHYCACILGRDLYTNPQWDSGAAGHYDLIPYLEHNAFINLSLDGTPLTVDERLRMLGAISGGLAITRARHGQVAKLRIKNLNGFTGGLTSHVANEIFQFYDIDVQQDRVNGARHGNSVWIDGGQKLSVVKVRVSGGVNGIIVARNNDANRNGDDNLMMDAEARDCGSGISFTGSYNKISQSKTYLCGAGVTFVAGHGNMVNDLEIHNEGHPSNAGVFTGIELRNNAAFPVKNNRVSGVKMFRVQRGVVLRSTASLNDFRDVEIDAQFFHPATNAPNYGAVILNEAPLSAGNTFARIKANGTDVDALLKAKLLDVNHRETLQQIMARIESEQGAEALAQYLNTTTAADIARLNVEKSLTEMYETNNPAHQVATLMAQPIIEALT